MSCCCQLWKTVSLMVLRLLGCRDIVAPDLPTGGDDPDRLSTNQGHLNLLVATSCPFPGTGGLQF